MVKHYCDKCKKDVGEGFSKKTLVTLDTYGKEQLIELCLNCFADLKNWINVRTPPV